MANYDFSLGNNGGTDFSIGSNTDFSIGGANTQSYTPLSYNFGSSGGGSQIPDATKPPPSMWDKIKGVYGDYKDFDPSKLNFTGLGSGMSMPESQKQDFSQYQKRYKPLFAYVPPSMNAPLYNPYQGQFYNTKG